MAGMLQIITYLLCFFLVVLGILVLQIALASPRERRMGALVLGIATLVACVGAGIGFAAVQAMHVQAHDLQKPAPPPHDPEYDLP